MDHHTEIVEPARMTASARRALIDDLYACHDRIFAGVTCAQFAAYVVDSPARRTRIMVLRDREGQARGYAAFHAFEQMHLGRPSVVIRMESGVEPAWRGRKLFSGFVLANVLRTLVRYPTRPIWFFACFVHPSAYVSCIRHAPELWPRPGEEAPASMTAVMQSVVEAFHMTPTKRPGVFQVGWITRGARPPARVCPEAAWYMARNPGYRDGHGLLTVMPVNVGRLARAAFSVARARLARLLVHPAVAHAAIAPN